MQYRESIFRSFERCQKNTTCTADSVNNELECLEYAYKYGCPCTEDIWENMNYFLKKNIKQISN